MNKIFKSINVHNQYIKYKIPFINNLYIIKWSLIRNKIPWSQI